MRINSFRNSGSKLSFGKITDEEFEKLGPGVSIRLDSDFNIVFTIAALTYDDQIRHDTIVKVEREGHFISFTGKNLKNSFSVINLKI